MLTRLEIDGFKSLQDFAVDLEPFTVFIGPNSAGKSNVLEALALLSRLAAMPIAEAFRTGRGRSSDQFSRLGPNASTAKRMRFAVEFLEYGGYQLGASAAVPDGQSRFRYELTIERTTRASGAEQLTVCDERLLSMRAEDDRWIESHPEFRALAAYPRGGEAEFATDPERRIIGLPARRSEEVRVPPTHTALSTVRYMGALHLRHQLERFRILRPDASLLGEPSDPLDSGELAENGSNLSTVLAGLPPAVLGAIKADLVALVPGVASFAVVRDDDEVRIEFELSGGERMPARLVSDGTLRILLLLTVLRLEPRRALIAIEEPENGIYPGRLGALLGYLRAETLRRHDDPAALAELAAEIREAGAEGIHANLLPTQVLLTTHSPVLLGVLRRHPQHLRFVDAVRRDGRRVTRVRAVAASTERGRATISPAEIDKILHTAQSEEP